VAEDQRNGPLTFYHINYKTANPTDSFSDVVSVNSTETSAVLENLHPWTEYTVIVEAENVAGRGPPSPEISVKTFALGLWRE
jgi:hypothetical protein